jgi:hypothetical protein
MIVEALRLDMSDGVQAARTIAHNARASRTGRITPLQKRAGGLKRSGVRRIVVP